MIKLRNVDMRYANKRYPWRSGMGLDDFFVILLACYMGGVMINGITMMIMDMGGFSFFGHEITKRFIVTYIFALPFAFGPFGCLIIKCIEWFSVYRCNRFNNNIIKARKAEEDKIILSAERLKSIKFAKAVKNGTL